MFTFWYIDMWRVLLLLITCTVEVSSYGAYSKIQNDYAINRDVWRNGTIRSKRDGSFLDKQPLTFKLQIVIDYEAVKFARLHLKESEVYRVLNEIGAAAGHFGGSDSGLEEREQLRCCDLEGATSKLKLSPLYLGWAIVTVDDLSGSGAHTIDDCFVSFNTKLLIKSKITRIDVMRKPIPEIERLPHFYEPTERRRTTCAKTTLTKLSELFLHSSGTDHTLVLTGLGVSMDTIERGKKYIMSPILTSAYDWGSNWMAFSPESRQALRSYLKDLKVNDRKCLTMGTRPLVQPRVNMGMRMTYDQQCQLAVGMTAVKDQPIQYICSTGIKCENKQTKEKQLILPYPGTPCREDDATLTCRWKECRR